jgi:hypothetical protein
MNNSKDIEHLRLLSIFHYVVGGIGALFALFPLIHLVIGIAFLVAPEHFVDSNSGNRPPAFIGYIFVIVGAVIIVIGETMAMLTIYSGVQIKKRKKYMFSFVVACILCIFIPFGTILGVFTIIVLSRDSVKKLYEQA